MRRFGGTSGFADEIPCQRFTMLDTPAKGTSSSSAPVVVDREGVMGVALLGNGRVELIGEGGATGLNGRRSARRGGRDESTRSGVEGATTTVGATCALFCCTPSSASCAIRSERDIPPAEPDRVELLLSPTGFAGGGGRTRSVGVMLRVSYLDTRFEMAA